ncbi:Major royal jelly protein [Flavobacterium columnare]|uniref:L-dopachrome tautomerase-related protein n=2 Tax=Flavobacterium TaxID=237 RepID=A0ABW8PRJ7_9FLAO|nr:L-dopachrome tautomerase-related protein [Flavobacterium columnare]SPE77952.1 Major royal jelly protein [Flavobacterium columnare]
MKKNNLFISIVFAFLLIISFETNVYAQLKADKNSQLEIVAEMQIRPGNVAVSNKGVVYSTIHPLGNPSMQLVVIKDAKTIEAFPNMGWQRGADQKATPTTFDTPLGITTDENGNLWVIDMGLNLGQTRLFCFSSESKENIFSLTFPEEVAPKGSFIQDLAVDIKNGFIYLADIANPGIIVVNIKTKAVKRLKQHPSFLSEDIDTVIDFKIINFGGKPARVAINPITISADKETVFYGAMNGKTWYSISARAIRKNEEEDKILATIKKVGDKPISDGVATDKKGNHYFTNLNDKGIDKWNAKTKKLEPFIRDARLLWADNISLQNGYLYISVNQLHKTIAFSGTIDSGKPPYFIYKIKINKL